MIEFAWILLASWRHKETRNRPVEPWNTTKYLPKRAKPGYRLPCWEEKPLWIGSHRKQRQQSKTETPPLQSSKAKANKKKSNYFTSSDPHHDMLGGGCQVRGCHWEYDGKNGEFENIDFRFPWLSDTSEMGFGHDVHFLNYSDRLPHPSDLCQPDRVRWGRHTTHLLKCVPLLSTSQTDWKQSSDVLSDISFDILSDISSDISSDILSDISFDILSDIFLTYLLTFFLTNLLTLFLTYLLTYLSTCFLTYLRTFFLTYQTPKPNIHRFTQKAALQTLHLPHTTQQK